MSVQEPQHGIDARDRSFGELVSQLSTDTTTLVKQEIALLRAELQETGKQAGKGAGLVGAGGVVGLLAAGALTACFILALDLVVASWLAALIVAVVYGAIAAVLALRGKNEIQDATPPAPQTVETLKEDGKWAKTRT
jgi:uncharacterized protein YacL